ncbi:MAG: Hsp70 family protein [Bacteroidia bacterium]|nr:Hsp70 family protein [Bacteroidia bacterium]MCF8428438.1 Hsp70 family protein [Bacteroidia bacterium]MCF8447673.1 Hsp70 family protein [Bacteroidia bacterium]
MEKMINYGIDLGTTNSAIAKFVKGEVEVFKNPLETGKETLPSVVYYKKDKVVVGTNARTYFERDAENVFGTFKRKMGTTESFKVKSINQSKTPIELSAEVLKELKGFVHSGESFDAAVITIPASFDVIQSNATKEAGYLAGFKQVILLQEPIAASLAYANKHKERDLENGQWLVYDLGGGTFDVALIKIKDGEMKVLDHEGDNFLGGADFDNLIIEKLIIPYLNKNFTFNDLENEMKSRTGKLNKLYFRILKLAEDAKITLSSRTSAEIEVRDITDDNGEEIDISIDITRSEFEGVIKEYIDKTLDMIKKILVRNSLKPSDIQFTLMVGGSTYTPYVRKRVEEILQIPINCDIDPTTAIAIGAAYYAGTKEKSFEQGDKKKATSGIKVRLAYQKTSQEDEEILAGRIEGNIDGLFYQITREDKGYDSGRKPLTNRISEDLPLVKNSYNFFRFTVLDDKSNIVETDAELIGIAQGKYNVAGQPLPHDICLETDNDPELEANSTKLDLFFQKNTILPQKRTKQYTLHKTILKGGDDKIVINVLEGPQSALPEANQSIGYIEIDGSKVSRDILRGTEIEITLEMSESRDLKVTVYIPMSDQQFSEVFNPSQRHLPVTKLQDEVETLSEKLEEEIEEAVEREDYETADQLTALKRKVDDLVINTNSLTSDDVTDKKFQFEDNKRKIAQEIDDATRDKRISILKIKYNEDKEWCKKLVDENGNDHDHKIFGEIVGREQVFLNSITPVKIMEAIEELLDLGSNILWRTPEFLIGRFKRLIEKPQLFNDQEQAKSLIEAGNMAITNKNFDRLREINFGLISLLPKSAQQEAKTGKIGF